VDYQIPWLEKGVKDLEETKEAFEAKKEVKTITSQAVEKELDRMRYQRRFALTMRSTIFTLVVVAAIAILVAVLLMPVLRIYGRSMNDTLDEGDIVVSVKTGTFETGDVIAFYYNNKILVKRVIGQSGDWIDIDTDGNVYVNNVLVEEPFLKEKAFGDCNITLPYQVPDERIFVMGDNRVSSVDSRNTAVGCVAEEQVVGKIVFRVWPLSKIGSL
jgi:signal peptidase I